VQTDRNQTGGPSSTTRRAAVLLGAGAIGTVTFGRNEAPAVSKEAKVPAALVQTVRDHALPLRDGPSAFSPILDMARNASFVLIGEASHGTHEFYATRAQLTRRLIEDHGFNAVVLEANFPETARINRFVRGLGTDKSAAEALSEYKEFPEWMWRNTDVRDFVAWLRDRNSSVSQGTPQAGIYGMDLYSLFRSRDEVLRYLQASNSAEAEKATERYKRFAKYSDPQKYGAAAAYQWGTSAAKGVHQQFEAMKHLGANGGDADFEALQNARVVRNSEEYFRQMYAGSANTWNLRDRHMADTLDALAEHLRRRDGHARIVVWAHNSHLGDARATESSSRGEWNLGQLVRERHPGESVLVGFSTSTGTVMAAHDWGSPGVVKQVRPALPGSYERAFQESGIPAFVLPLRHEPVAKELRRPLLQRAIGVIYRPQTERQSHYFEARLSQQFDAMIHFDRTRAVEPLKPSQTEIADVESAA
jgi:erythromycin esterase-like protein